MAGVHCGASDGGNEPVVGLDVKHSLPSYPASITSPSWNRCSFTTCQSPFASRTWKNCEPLRQPCTHWAGKLRQRQASSYHCLSSCHTFRCFAITHCLQFLCCGAGQGLLLLRGGQAAGHRQQRQHSSSGGRRRRATAHPAGQHDLADSARLLAGLGLVAVTLTCCGSCLLLLP